MAAGGDWASLPSVVLEDIFSKLSPKDRIRASSTCHKWREYLFLPQFWPVITFNLSYKGRSRSRFFSSKCAKFVKEVTIEFNSTRCSQVWDCTRLLELLSRNGQLECLSLRPSNCYFDGGDGSLESFLESLRLVVKRNRRLLHLSLGCTEILLNNSQEVLSLLVKYHAPYLQSLHLASVKEDSSSYSMPFFGLDCISAFSNLRSLSLDYDFLSPKVMFTLAHRQHTAPPLQSLSIHVHRVGHQPINEKMWKELVESSPNMELTLSFVHSLDGIQALLDILKPSMPLTHFRQYFCGDISVAALNMMSNHYRSTLRSLTIIEAIEMQPINYNNYDTEDPFVMLAWRCTRLEVLKLIGVSLDQKDLVAIARLRSGLRELMVPSCCVFWSEEDEDYYDEDEALLDLQYKVSESLGRRWQLLPEFSVPPAVFFRNANADNAYMNELLEDQTWRINS
ncbi:F-box only protein 33 [Biomphalaria glabrata]|uniref:F-box domain-containing protein n=2 Tax=Biomphalaria TaxID=6525 RepID=A0A2C9LA97_BIOGL|nr:F-box only protein 33-like [Biomphalaria glabrata]KAI8777851.1 F-box only protein 33 [Biomphalaria glabrata]KAK0054575.1 F-box only protein 33 [Biomphalaria pfeifferi]